mmetsp:Transcript_24573/g.50757  ORF Transcript_24573/g.50757 Transcript_24573/m.50757 type:complete len:204 (+) Transcript_24573:211-822(+)
MLPNASEAPVQNGSSGIGDPVGRSGIFSPSARTIHIGSPYASFRSGTPRRMAWNWPRISAGLTGVQPRMRPSIYTRFWSVLSAAVKIRLPPHPKRKSREKVKNWPSTPHVPSALVPHSSLKSSLQRIHVSWNLPTPTCSSPSQLIPIFHSLPWKSAFVHTIGGGPSSSNSPPLTGPSGAAKLESAQAYGSASAASGRMPAPMS